MSGLDPEVVDLLAGRPDLLAVADAVAATQRRPGGNARWRLLAVAATIGVAIVLAIVAPWRGHGGGLVQRALAAVGDKPVLHAVIESRAPQQTIVNLKTGAKRPATQSEEYWFDNARHLLRFRTSIEGQIVVQALVRRQPGYSPGVNPALETFVSGYRAALSSGKARAVGRGVVGGRKVTWVAIDFGGSRERVAIDSLTYRPILIEELDAKGRIEPLIWHVREIDTRPRIAADFVTPARPTLTSAGFTPEPPIPAGRAASILGWTPVWLGDSFGGVPLTSAQVQRSQKAQGASPARAIGLLLNYSVGLARILIEEARRPSIYNGFFPTDPLPVVGTAVVTELVGFGSGCRAQLQTDHVWVTINAFATDACVLAARALVPIGSRLVNRPFSIPIPRITPARSGRTASPSPNVCARAWNQHASAGARQLIGDDRPLSALVHGGSIGSVSFSFGGKTTMSVRAGCFITFFLPGDSVVSTSAVLLNGTLATWQTPSTPFQTRGSPPTGNASVSADGTVRVR